MKYVITGHKHGLGSAIVDRLLYYNSNQRHEIIGYDIDDGYNISDLATVAKIVWRSRDADVFVNNAYDQDGQYQLLQYFTKMWRGNSSKLIVNIGSFLIGESELALTMLNEKEIVYVEQKKEQKKFIDAYRIADQELKIIQINPGLLDTNFTYTLGRVLPDNIKLHSTLETAQLIINLIDASKKGLYTTEITINNLIKNEP